MPVTRGQGEKEREYQTKLGNAKEDFLDEVRGNSCLKKKPQEFTALAIIAKGGFGTLYKARCDELGEVVIKAELRGRFNPMDENNKAMKEKMFLMSLNSVFVLRGLATFKDTENLNLVMEYAPYGSFTRLLPLRGADEGKAYFAQIFCGIEYLHAADIVHGDMKPDNVMVFDGGRLKIGDFGHTQISRDSLNALVGTLSFTAPEVLLSDFYGDSIDWWAFGLILYVGLLGSHPYYGSWFMVFIDLHIICLSQFYITLVQGRVFLSRSFGFRSPILPAFFSSPSKCSYRCQ